MPTYRHFVGRDAELDRFRQVLDDPAGQAVLVVGPQGMGKTTLADRFLEIAREKHHCPGVRYEVIRSDTPATTMERILHNAHAVAQEDGSFSGAPHRRQQWQALFDVLPKGKELSGLVRALHRDEKRPVREQLGEVFHSLSKALPEDTRVLFLLDSEKSMHPDSEEPWTVVVRDLPPRIKLLFAQRPDDVLASSFEFGRLDNVVRIPDGPLDTLDPDAVSELIDLCRSGAGYSTGELSTHLAAADGHPYVVAGSLDLLLEGTRLDDLPSDPGRIAEEQWKKVCELGEEAERLFQAHAVLEVPVPDDVVREVAELSPPEHRKRLRDRFLDALLREEEGGFRRVYHSLLTDHVLAELEGSGEELGELHARAAAAYRTRLNLEGKPDALALQRLPEHVLAAEGEAAFVRVAIYECEDALQRLGLWADAEGLLQQARETAERLEMHAELAEAQHRLGIAAELRGSYDEALEWYRKSLEIHEELGNRAGMASSYHQLGNVSYRRGSYDEALDWYRKALEIHEELGNRAGMANSYHQLGMVAQLRGSYEEALGWYRKALEIDEELGNRAGMASTISQLGVLATAQDRPEEAVPLNLRSLAIRLEIGSPEAWIDLHWLTRQRELLGDERFRELLAEHTGEEGGEKVLELMAQYEEARRQAEGEEEGGD